MGEEREVTVQKQQKGCCEGLCVGWEKSGTTAEEPSAIIQKQDRGA